MGQADDKINQFHGWKSIPNVNFKLISCQDICKLYLVRSNYDLNMSKCFYSNLDKIIKIWLKKSKLFWRCNTEFPRNGVQKRLIIKWGVEKINHIYDLITNSLKITNFILRIKFFGYAIFSTNKYIYIKEHQTLKE